MRDEQHRLRLPEEAGALAQKLSTYFPDAAAGELALRELLLNAIEHGNLEFGFTAKARLLRLGQWHTALSARLQHPHFRSRWVQVGVRQARDVCAVVIADAGRGFAWRHQMALNCPGDGPNGRGLWLVRRTAGLSLKFNDCGNRVVCASAYSSAESPARFPQARFPQAGDGPD